MITLITGAPGAGKSAYLVSQLLELSKGRTVYADGIPDLLIDHQPLGDASQWHNTVPDGSVIVIDEVQRIWRPRGPGSKVPESVTELETHRHRTLDFYLITQAPRLLDTNVRALVGRHVHLRELGFLGRWFYEWPECAENCAASWKNAPIKKRYTLPKNIFGMYTSASGHIKPVRSFPKMVVVLALCVMGLAFGSWRVYDIIKSKNQQAHIPQGAVESPVNSAGTMHSESSDSAQPKYIDDRTAFIPRSSDKPESAPAYDHLRIITEMPIVSGGLCASREEVYSCQCFTQQGTDAGLSSAQCEYWMANRAFNPYRKAPENSEYVRSEKSEPAAERSAASTVAEPDVRVLENTSNLPRMSDSI